MTDTCTVTRVTGSAINSTTLEYTDTTSTIYSGACRVQIRNMTTAQTALAGEREVVALMLEVWLPLTASVDVGDKVTITASDHDANLVGRVFRVRELFHKSHLTSRRTLCEEEQT